MAEVTVVLKNVTRKEEWTRERQTTCLKENKALSKVLLLHGPMLPRLKEQAQSKAYPSVNLWLSTLDQKKTSTFNL